MATGTISRDVPARDNPPSEADLHVADAKRYIALAQANVELRQFRRATEHLLRAMADIQAADRVTVDDRERKDNAAKNVRAVGVVITNEGVSPRR